MKYFSEKLNTTFDTPEACIKAEKQFEEDQIKIKEELEKAVKEKEKKEQELAKNKKEAAKAIEVATNKLDEANKLYEAAKEKAAIILDESNKEATKILDAAAVKVREAEEERLNAILAFNKKYGTYTTTLTGAQAAEAYKKSIRSLNDTVRSIFKNFWF